MKKNFKLLLLICFWQFGAMAQSNDSLRLSFNFVPQYAFINGLKADVEYKLMTEVHVYLGGQYYTGLVNSNGSESVSKSAVSSADQSQRANDKIEGGGYHMGIKYYFTESGLENYYIGAEYSYTAYDFKFNDYSYFPYIDDGLQFYEYRLGEIAAKSSQSTYGVSLGVMQQYKRFVFNAWAGINFTQANTSDNFHNYRKYNTYFWGYAYQGWGTNIGLKVGVLLF